MVSGLAERSAQPCGWRFASARSRSVYLTTPNDREGDAFGLGRCGPVGLPHRLDVGDRADRRVQLRLDVRLDRRLPCAAVWLAPGQRDLVARVCMLGVQHGE